MAENIHIRKIRPTEAQAKEMIQVVLEAFRGTALQQAYFPRGKETEEEEGAYRVGQILRSLDDPATHYVAALLETALPDGAVHEEIIGYTGWCSPAVPGSRKARRRGWRQKPKP